MKVQSTKRDNNQQYKVFAYAERKADGEPCCIIESSEVSKAIGLDKLQTARLFSRLLAEGRIQQLQRELYLFPGRLPPGKKWRPSSYLVLASYLNWKKARWQISGLEALSRYGLTTQVPQSFFVYNSAYSGEKDVGGSRFIFVKVPEKKLGNVVTFDIPGSKLKLNYSSKARLIFDLIFEQSRLKMLPQAYQWIALFQNDKNILNELIDCALSYGNKASQQRIGFYLSMLGYKGKKMKLLKEAVGEEPALIPLIPQNRKGKLHRDWGIIENVDVQEFIGARAAS